MRKLIKEFEGNQALGFPVDIFSLVLNFLYIQTHGFPLPVLLANPETALSYDKLHCGHLAKHAFGPG